MRGVKLIRCTVVPSTRQENGLERNDGSNLSKKEAPTMLLFLESRCAWGNRQSSGVEVEVKVKERELGEALDWSAKLNTVPT